jgi:hypothetical protein
VVYASSDPSVGKPTNDVVPSSTPQSPRRGHRDSLGDRPALGLTSTATGDDVTLTVVPPLERCTILNTGPIADPRPRVSIDRARLYPGGFERNLATGRVVERRARDPGGAEHRRHRSRVKDSDP